MSWAVECRISRGIRSFTQLKCSFACFRLLPRSLSLSRSLGQLARLGCLLGLAWLLEYHPPFAHSFKAWDRDTYYALCLLLLLYSLQVSSSREGTHIFVALLHDRSKFSDPGPLTHQQCSHVSRT